MVTVYISKVVICHIQRNTLDHLFVVYPLEMVSPLYTYPVACHVTIQWDYIPPFICNAERLGVMTKPIGGALD